MVGLALESAVRNKRLNPTLSKLYSNPDLDAIGALYDRLVLSNNHSDREVAFWLELALPLVSVEFDLIDILVELREIEVLLSDLLWQVNPASQHAVNDWLNYIANVPQSIQDGRGIYAKILMSRAIQSCQRTSVEQIKKDLRFGNKIEILQRETVRLFGEIRKFPLKLIIPLERIDSIVQVQAILIDLLQEYYVAGIEEEIEDAARYVIQKLQTTKRYLLRADLSTIEAKREVEHASEYLESQGYDLQKRHIEWTTTARERLKRLLNSLEAS